jgi:hypothetical protein
VLDDKTKEKLRKEEEKIKKDALEMEKREKKEAKVAVQKDRPTAYAFKDIFDRNLTAEQ